MKLLKGLLLGYAAALVSAVSAQAADLPERQAAPIEYVRICDAYGAGFFYIPGTETCLKVGGLAMTEVRGYPVQFGVASVGAIGSAAKSANGGVGFAPSGYSNGGIRDAYGWDSLGRIELDARTATPYGALRSFIRVDSYVGTGSGASSGSLGNSGSFQNALYAAGTNNPTRETTIVNKAFIQFAGLTAGRAQSMFDFYADAYNYQKFIGSNATTQLLAYTYAFGNGFSGTFSIEDQNGRQAQVGSTVFVAANNYLVGTPAGTRWPDFVGNLRVDQPWGAVQLSAAAHEVRAQAYNGAAATIPSSAAPAGSVPSSAFPLASSSQYGWAIQGGVQLNVPYLSAGDKLWLQAAYEQGALNYVYGGNLQTSYGAVNGNRFYGSANTPSDSSNGWNTNMYDCIFTLSGHCERQTGWSVIAVYKHYWLPTLASAIFGGYAQINYSNNAIAGYGGAVGVSNLKNARIGTNLVWTPVKGFDIGAEFQYVNVTQSRPVGLASDAFLGSKGLPAWLGNENQYEGRIRVQRAF
jgi:hypothetical protein